MTDAARYPDLAGLPVVITGGASGIGAAMVRAFHAQGCVVAFLDKDEPAGNLLASSSPAASAPAPLFVTCDLRDIASLRAAMETACARNGDTAILINNAGNDDRHDFDNLTPDYWDDRLAVNLRHMVFVAQAAAAQMRRRGGGCIVNLGSTSWKLPTAGMIAYTTAKAAVHGLTKSLARELGRDLIRVNTLSPGWVMTGRQKSRWLDAGGEETMDRMQCLPLRIQPEDITAFALFLASSGARACTAQEYVVDAGWT